MISDSSLKWIENLAEQDVLISSGKISELDLAQTKEEVLALSTTAFIRELKAHCHTFIKIFNGRMQEAALALSMDDLADKAEGFMVQRNRIRLLFMTHQSGTIQIQCERGDSQKIAQFSPVFSGQIQAKFQSFDDVSWFFLEKPVTAEQFCRFYLTEFIQVSRSSEVLN